MANTAQAQRPRFSAAIQTDGYRKIIESTLEDPKRRQRFIANVTSAVSVNPALQECEPSTILSSALLCESLELPMSPQLGFFYFVPFKDNKTGRTVATPIVGYKGYRNLAQRSGVYRKIQAISVKKGEFVSYDPFEGHLEYRPITDPLARDAAETVGYYGVFELLNGYRETIYWPKEKMEQHALRYSKGYAAKKGYTFWEKGREEYDRMAEKTIVRQLLSHGAPMSVEMRTAFEGDESSAVIGGDGVPAYLADSEDAAALAQVDMETGEVIGALPDAPPLPQDDGVPQVGMDDL